MADNPWVGRSTRPTFIFWKHVYWRVGRSVPMTASMKSCGSDSICLYIFKALSRGSVFVLGRCWKSLPASRKPLLVDRTRFTDGGNPRWSLKFVPVVHDCISVLLPCLSALSTILYLFSIRCELVLRLEGWGR